MLLAITKAENGKNMIVLGLYQENIDRLLDDQPILAKIYEADVPEFANWQITILGPEDTERFVAQFGVQFIAKEKD